jgi:hypothetical protein
LLHTIGGATRILVLLADLLKPVGEEPNDERFGRNLLAGLTLAPGRVMIG